MADIWFSEEEKMFQGQMRKFVERECAPGAQERVTMKNMSQDHLKKVGEKALFSDSLLELPSITEGILIDTDTHILLDHLMACVGKRKVNEM